MEARAPLIRVIHVITRTNIGGPSVILASLLEDPRNSDIEQSLVRGTTSLDEGDYFEGSRLTSRIATVAELGRRVKPWDDLRALVALIRHFKKTQPDVVHTHMAKAGALGRIAAFIARVPVRVHTFHGHLLTGYFRPTTTRMVVIAERLLTKLTTFTVVVGSRVREDLIGARIVDERSSRVINPGVEPFTTGDKTASRNSLGLPGEGTIVMFVGRLVNIKRPDRFVEIARRLLDRPDLHFVMVGDGPLRSGLQSQSGGLSNLHFRSWQRDLGLVLGAADVVVMCSDNEGVPLLLIEAGMAGLPAVSTRVGSVDDVIRDGQTGLLVEPGDEEALVNAVRRLVDDRALSLRLGAAAHDRTLEKFTSGTATAAHAALYRELVRDARGDC